MAGKISIGIILFTDVEVLDFCGPFEVFSLAESSPGVRAFDVRLISQNSPVVARNGFTVVPTDTFDDCPKLDVVLVPGGPGTRPLVNDPAFLKILETVVSATKIVLSVCTGALFLGRLGRLDGLTVTTHHSALDLLKQMVPTAEVISSRVIDNGDLVMSGGVSAGIDMSLYFVERTLGLDCALAVAKQMEYVWNREGILIADASAASSGRSPAAK